MQKREQKFVYALKLSVIFTVPVITVSGVPRIWGGGHSTNSVEDRGHREMGSGGGSP